MFANKVGMGASHERGDQCGYVWSREVASGAELQPIPANGLKKNEENLIKACVHNSLSWS